MRLLIATILNLKTNSFERINISFSEGESITLLSVGDKVFEKLDDHSFILIAWSQVDKFGYW